MEAGTVFHWQPGDRVTVRYAGYKNDGLIYDARYKDGVIEAFDERLSDGRFRFYTVAFDDGTRGNYRDTRFYPVRGEEDAGVSTARHVGHDG